MPESRVADNRCKSAFPGPSCPGIFTDSGRICLRELSRSGDPARKRRDVHARKIVPGFRPMKKAPSTPVWRTDEASWPGPTRRRERVENGRIILAIGYHVKPRKTAGRPPGWDRPGRPILPFPVSRCRASAVSLWGLPGPGRPRLPAPGSDRVLGRGRCHADPVPARGHAGGLVRRARAGPGGDRTGRPALGLLPHRAGRLDGRSASPGDGFRVAVFAAEGALLSP